MMVSNCPRCQIVLLAWLVSNCPILHDGVILSYHWLQLCNVICTYHPLGPCHINTTHVSSWLTCHMYVQKTTWHFFNAVSQHTPANGGNHKKVNYPIGSHRLGRVDETNKDNCCATCFQEDYKFTNFGFWVFTLFEAPGYIEKKKLSN